MQKKIVKRYEKYGRKVGWIVYDMKKYGRKASWIVKRYEKYGRKASRIVKIKVITKLPNSEQSYKGKVKTPVFSISFHYSTYLSFIKSMSFHYFLLYFPYLFKSGSLRFSQFSGCWLILSVYIIMSFDFPFVRLFGVR
jgi:hypothetical protein